MLKSLRLLLNHQEKLMWLSHRITIDNLQLTLDKKNSFCSQMSSVRCRVFQKGQTLIEVVVAVGIAIILGISLVSASLVTQKAARAARNNTQAAKLAQEYIEEMRVFRDNKDDFSALTIGGCFTINTSDPDPGGWDLVACIDKNSDGIIDGETVPLNKTDFERKIAVEDITPTKKKITVTVNWREGTNPRTITDQTYLSDRASWTP